MDKEDLRLDFYNEQGINWENEQGEPDIDYVEWLESKILPHPIKFGRWLLKNAVPMFNKEGLLCWYKENSEKDTHELYDEFMKDETLPPQD
jgi:hypothetical protein